MSIPNKPAGETDPNYADVILQLSDRVRIVLSKAKDQYILQEQTAASVRNPKPGCYYSKAFMRRRAGVAFVCKKWGFVLTQDQEQLFQGILI